ncbi:hypothetical protein JQK15_04040 [Sphingobium sp. BHU LFT2]|uniref:hypothetical protein n=1 Tax=Sphingobium sp. BHU LFT2 TaxID=2807634 RepID=UPI001BEBFEB8|nr:hypothetical protein [Sphingobium sp. BHU LFT2]MBT2242700.1 hypothetical protein [Sphingobium sp. BHU LFT2]
MGQAARAVAGLSPEDEEGLRRTHRDRRRAAWADVETWVIRAVGAIAIILAAGFAGLALYVVWKWLGFTLTDAKKTEDLVKGTLWTGLVALATWGGKNLLKRDE